MAEMTGEDKAGLLLLNLDPRVADLVLNQLGPAAKARLQKNMKRLQASPQRHDFLEQVMDEAEKLLGPRPRLAGGPDAPGPAAGPSAPTTSREWTVADPPNPKGKPADDPAAKTAPTVSLPMRPDMPSAADKDSDHGSEVAAALSRFPADRLLQTLEGENARTIGSILNVLPGETAGAIFKALESKVRRDVSVYMATGLTPGPKVLQCVVNALLAKEKSLPETPVDSKGDTRLKKMAALLWTLDRADRTEALAALQERDAAVAGLIRELLYQFSDLLLLEPRSIQKILGQSETKTLAVALKGASDALKQKILDNMSKRARESMTEEMEFLGSVPAGQIQQAEKVIVGLFQRLDEAGELTREVSGS